MIVQETWPIAWPNRAAGDPALPRIGDIFLIIGTSKPASGTRLHSRGDAVQRLDIVRPLPERQSAEQGLFVARLLKEAVGHRKH